MISDKIKNLGILLVLCCVLQSIPSKALASCSIIDAMNHHMINHPIYGWLGLFISVIMAYFTIKFCPANLEKSKGNYAGNFFSIRSLSLFSTFMWAGNSTYLLWAAYSATPIMCW